MGAFIDLFAQLGADPGKRGTQFERITKWFLENDPYYKELFNKVWLWKEWPVRPSDTEAGIDLVAQDRDGQVWAIQCKAYAIDRRIPKSELNKFLSESNTKAFQHRLLVSTTTRGLHQLAQRTVDGQDKPVSIIDLEYLETSTVDWPLHPADLHPSESPKPAQPHDYQLDAIKDVVKGFKSSDRGQLIMACGTGKTLTSLFIKEKLDAQRTLVLVPSLSLLKQTMRVWYANKTVRFDSRPVCSDDTVRRDDDAAVAYVSDLGMRATTDPAEIAKFLRKRGPRVVFATYQSSQQIAKAFKVGRVPSFDLVIADEAHRCAGPVSSDFATILDRVAIPAKRRLFMTATPRYFTGRVIKAAIEADFEYASMDDETKFGSVFHKLGFSEAIKEGLLTDYQVAVIGVDDATYKEWTDKGNLVTLDGKTPINARTLAGQIGLTKAMRKYNLRRTISFHSRVSSAKRFAASMYEVMAWMPARRRPTGRLWAEHVSGEMPAGERYQLLQQLSELNDDEFGLLTNARCLGEGVDVPTLDGVAFIDPRRSEVDIVQAVGRAIRKADDKTVGTIVIPVFIDTDEDPQIALDSSVFKPVWDVIRALRSHDEELGRQLDELRRDQGRLGGIPRLPDRIHHDLPTTVCPDFEAAFYARLLEQTTASWQFWFGLFENYVQQHGHARIAANYKTEDGHPLGTWATSQRVAYKAGTLASDRKHRLENIHPTWAWDALAAWWEEGFGHLREYVEIFGDARIHQHHKTPDGYPIGSWTVTQRAAYNKGNLDADRIRRLENVHPTWTWDAFAAKWDDAFAQLAQYVEQNNHALVPTSYAASNGYPLGYWVGRQRKIFREGKLSQERISRLENIHPTWSWDPLTAQWEEAFNHLRDYVEKQGHACVPQRYRTADDFQLGAWVNTQRMAYRERGTRRLRAEHQARLEKIHPTWTW